MKLMRYCVQAELVGLLICSRCPPHLYRFTFTAHPWAFCDPADPSAVLVVEGQAVIYGPPHTQGSQRPRLVIREANRQPWSPACHMHTPPTFQQQAVALLLCHRRLARGHMLGAATRKPVVHGAWHERLHNMACPCWRYGAEQAHSAGQPSGQAEGEEAGALLPATPNQAGLGDLPQVTNQEALSGIRVCHSVHPLCGTSTLLGIVSCCRVAS